jgi:hypothetical protein
VLSTLRTHPIIRAACAVFLAAALLLTPQVASSDSSDPAAITLRVQTPTYELTDGGVTVPGYSLNREPGAPMLPVYYELVELPVEGSWDLAFETPGATLLAATSSIPAAPTPDLGLERPLTNADVDELPQEATTVDRPDPAIYGVDAFYPQAVVVAGEEQRQRGRRFLPVQVYPFQYNPATGQLRYAPDVQVTIRVKPGDDKLQAAAPGQVSDVNPPASSGNAARIYTAGRGMHRLTYTNLVAAGVPLATTPVSNFAMYYLGQPIDIQVIDRNGNDRFDADDLVVFFAEPYQGRYMTRNVYWFAYGASGGGRMGSRGTPITGSEPVVTQVTQIARLEVDKVYQSQINLPAGQDRYFDEALYPSAAAGRPVTARNYTLPVDDPVASAPATLRVRLYGGVAQAPDPDQSVAISVNNAAASVHQWEGVGGYTATASVPGSRLTAPSSQIRLEAALSQLPLLAYYWIHPEWLELSYTAIADAENDRIGIEAAPAGANHLVVTGFTIPGVHVYDVRDPRRPVELTTVDPQQDGATYTIHFWDVDLPDPTYELATESALLAPVAVEADTPSTWRSPGHDAAYIAIAHSDVWSAVQPLLNYREAEGLPVARVNIQDVYDEFGYGRVDPEAIREFLGYAYHNWNDSGDPPEFVLLAGDGHHDFKGVEGSTLKNMIPPYLAHIDPWIGETAADNRYASVDGPDDFLPDMHIGRISAQNSTEMMNAVNKILAYEQSAPAGPWRENVTFVADSCNDPVGDFNAISELVRQKWLPRVYTANKLYYRIVQPNDNCPNANFTDPAAMRAAINSAYNGQNLLIQWFGHGSRFRWGSVSLFNTTDVVALPQTNVWPMVMHYTCYTGYFHNVYQNRQSLAELELLSAGKGSVVSFAATGQHLGTDELVMNYGVNKALFYDRLPRIGQVIDAARYYYYANSPTYMDLIDSSVLLGDPALKTRVLTQSFSTFLPAVRR